MGGKKSQNGRRPHRGPDSAPQQGATDRTAEFFRRFDSWPGLLARVKMPPRFNDVDPIYALPDLLIDGIDRYCRGFLMREELEFERALAEYCRDYAGAGFWSGVLVPAGPLEQEDPEAPITDQTFENIKKVMAAYGWTDAGLQGRLKDLNTNAAMVSESLRGYAGWLLTNVTYRQELDALKQRATAVDWPAGQMPPVSWLHDPVEIRTEDPRMEFVKAYQDFCMRWCLVKLLTWDLPLPQGPLLPSPLQHVPKQLGKMGISLFVPLTVKLPPDVLAISYLRAWQEQATQPDPYDTANTWRHLREWCEVKVRHEEENKDIGTFANLFLAYFYWKELLRRYGDKVEGQRMNLHSAFGRFLTGQLPSADGERPGERMSQKLLTMARQRLGPEAHV